jgi:uncharacterized protein with ParB-like and HNH nuclease domain
LVVDGQQRLTTLSVLPRSQIIVLSRKNPTTAIGSTSSTLLNKWKQGDLRPKLLPTQADRPAYVADSRRSRGRPHPLAPPRTTRK